jgi:hypothetical protein
MTKKLGHQGGGRNHPQSCPMVGTKLENFTGGGQPKKKFGSLEFFY